VECGVTERPLDEDMMRRAIENAASVRCTTAPNPWVGAVVVTSGGEVHDGATEPPGGRHAEVVALDRAGDAVGSTIYSTLEPCTHTGRTGPCVERIIASGVSRVVYAIDDPDPKVAGRAAARLTDAGIDVVRGVGAADVTDQLVPYLTHRRTGRPYVVVKLAATLDGRIAAPDGTSRWITGPEARTDVHRLRAESGAILVGAGTVRADDPELTVRDATGPSPRRVVLGRAPAGARVHPCLEHEGDLGGLLDRLGAEGVLQLMVEGGASVAAAFHHAGLVDRYVVYLAPKLMGGDDATGLFRGAGVPTMAEVWTGRFAAVTRLGDDLRIDLVSTDPTRPHHPEQPT
jgi:diaminohydroxyphosphoribosylaminopyrimidine deaminase/5-amino-6-(5-phosphoribosylamino)uracil reductase